MGKKKYYATSKIPQKKAQLYGEELMRIKEKYRELRPEYVVKEAKKRKNPLHDYFEWNDDKASQKYRLWQAREIIGAVAEVVVIGTKETKQRSFFNYRTTKEGGVYVTLQEAVTRSPYRRHILQKIITHLKNTQELMQMFMEYEDKK